MYTVLAFLPFNPKILKALNSLTLSHQNEALQIMYTKCPEKEKKKERKVKEDGRSKQKEKVKFKVLFKPKKYRGPQSVLFKRLSGNF